MWSHGCYMKFTWDFSIRYVIMFWVWSNSNIRCFARNNQIMTKSCYSIESCIDVNIFQWQLPVRIKIKYTFHLTREGIKRQPQIRLTMKLDLCFTTESAGWIPNGLTHRNWRSTNRSNMEHVEIKRKIQTSKARCHRGHASMKGFSLFLRNTLDFVSGFLPGRWKVVLLSSFAIKRCWNLYGSCLQSVSI